MPQSRYCVSCIIMYSFVGLPNPAIIYILSSFQLSCTLGILFKQSILASFGKLRGTFIITIQNPYITSGGVRLRIHRRCGSRDIPCSVPGSYGLRHLRPCLLPRNSSIRLHRHIHYMHQSITACHKFTSLSSFLSNYIYRIEYLFYCQGIYFISISSYFDILHEAASLPVLHCPCG